MYTVVVGSKHLSKELRGTGLVGLAKERNIFTVPSWRLSANSVTLQASMHGATAELRWCLQGLSHQIVQR